MRLFAWLAGAGICFAMVQSMGMAWIIIAIPLFLAWTLMLFAMGMAK